jgi:site-specific DNA-methyltransferase (adenine-specific)
MILHGDCLDLLPTLEANSIDAIVTDPPYGLGFMGKHWDHGVPNADVWRECLRVLKPGGHLLAFAGTRTQHRMACNIEDAGFEIRDMIAWVYGSGFPKSHNGPWGGTALKPALEPITVARKPLVGTVAWNVMEWGTGGLNIDGCRVGTSKNVPASISKKAPANCYGKYAEAGETPGIGGHDPNIGRWPANLIHDGSDEVVSLFPNSAGAGGSVPNVKITGYGDGIGTGKSDYFGGERKLFDSGSGSAARFFYCSKASKRDREEGCEGMLASASGGRANAHPTVKPTDLMRYLCRLVTPKGGVVLDPFAGSGSTGKAAMIEGFRFVGIEREAEYVAIAEARIKSAECQMRDAGQRDAYDQLTLDYMEA